MIVEVGVWWVECAMIALVRDAGVSEGEWSDDELDEGEKQPYKGRVSGIEICMLPFNSF